MAVSCRLSATYDQLKQMRSFWGVLMALALSACAATPTLPPVRINTPAPTLEANASNTPTQITLPTVVSTSVPTLCPQATPELFYVAAVKSPTNLLTQTIKINIGNGDRVTVTATSPASTTVISSETLVVEVPLQVNATTRLTVEAHVRDMSSGGCKFGDYVLRTERDRDGKLLEITQQIELAPTETPIPPKILVPTARPIALTQQPKAAPDLQVTRAPAESNCATVSYSDWIKRGARPAAVASLPAGACVNVEYESGDKRKHTWYPSGSVLALGKTMYVRWRDASVTVFTQGGKLMAREFVTGQRAQDLALTFDGGRVLLTASRTAIFQDAGGGKYTALVDVLVRE